MTRVQPTAVKFGHIPKVLAFGWASLQAFPSKIQHCLEVHCEQQVLTFYVPNYHLKIENMKLINKKKGCENISMI